MKFDIKKEKCDETFSLALDGDDWLFTCGYDDIFICKERVLSQAEEYGHSVLREFAFLCTHGIYHLLGYDHQNAEEERVMFEKQEKILKELKIER